MLSLLRFLAASTAWSFVAISLGVFGVELDFLTMGFSFGSATGCLTFLTIDFSGVVVDFLTVTLMGASVWAFGVEEDFVFAAFAFRSAADFFGVAA